MALCARKPVSLVALLLLPFFVLCAPQGRADSARFDLVGPSIDVRVTRGDASLPIAAVPNLQPGDRLWLHPDLPPTQSVHYLLICVFLRGTTNPPPDDWFIRIETWQRKVREEGVFVTVPDEAQQAVLFLAPETGGDFSTLRSAVEGRPGVFVRASQDLAEAGFEQARIEKYLASIRRVPPSNPEALQKHSELLARTLNLKPNEACFKEPIDTQFTCLTQTGSQTLLDDGHEQSVVSALSSGPGSDFINAASATSLAGGGAYSAYVGAVVDLVRIMGKLHTAQYQYIPAIAFPQNEALNLRLNTPPSFRNPKSVLVIGLPAIQKAVPPPLRLAEPNHVACLLRPHAVLPIEGAPLVFSTAFANNLRLHFNTPPGAPAEADEPLTADAYQGGLILGDAPEHHVELRDVGPLPLSEASAFAHPELAASHAVPVAAAKPIAEPIQLTGTIEGDWGFDSFSGPTIPLQQLPGGGWHIVAPAGKPASDGSTGSSVSAGSSLIVGQSAELLIDSTGSACVHTITADPNGQGGSVPIAFRPAAKSGEPNLLELTLPLENAATPGSLHISVQQYGQPKADVLSTRTFAPPAQISSIEIHAGDSSLVLTGSNLAEVDTLTLGDLVFSPKPGAAPADGSFRLALATDSPTPPTSTGDHLTARIALRDERTLTLPVTVLAHRPVLTLLSKTISTPVAADSGSSAASADSAANAPAAILLANSNDLPLSRILTFTLKSAAPFPRDGQIEVETVDGTLRTVLTLAPSGGLLLQDPHTVVATLDPLRSFGPSAFGPLQARAVYPAKALEGGRRKTENSTESIEKTGETTSSDWLALGTLVRLPELTGLQCPADTTQPCVLSGSDLFLMEAVSADAAFTDPVPVPDGFTGTTLSIPQPATTTLFMHLRDDPNGLCTASLPVPAAALIPAKTTGRKAGREKHSAP